MHTQRSASKRSRLRDTTKVRTRLGAAGGARTGKSKAWTSKDVDKRYKCAASLSVCACACSHVDPRVPVPGLVWKVRSAGRLLGGMPTGASRFCF